jgi:predicted acetyltransferase
MAIRKIPVVITYKKDGRRRWEAERIDPSANLVWYIKSLGENCVAVAVWESYKDAEEFAREQNDICRHYGDYLQGWEK